MMFKGRICITLLLLTILVLCATLSLAKEDPELKQCKHQCRHQRQFDKEQRMRCERGCEEYVEEKQRTQREREREMGKSIGEEEEVEESNPRRDPEREYRRCRERCQEGEEGRRQQQICESECEAKRRQQEREREREELEERFPRREEREEEEEEEVEEKESGNPYLFEDEHFKTHFRTQEGFVKVIPKFTERSSMLFKGIENYRLAVVVMNPQTFLLPHHSDADYVFYVSHGRGTISLLFTDRKESFNVERGHIIVIPAGITAYMINRDDHEKFVFAKVVHPVANPGRFALFFGPGGQDPESYFSAFSSEVLEAAFKTSRDRVQRIFSQQREGVIVKASKEQIRSMSQEEGSHWPFGGKGSRDFGPFHLLKQRPKESNEFGKFFEVDSRDFRQLQDLDIAITYSNITRGSMHTPYYNSKVTKITVVANGSGHFEMACPHVKSGPSGERPHRGGGRTRRGEEAVSPIHYEKIRGELRPGSVFIVPAGHPFTTIAARDENLELICFELNAENNHRFPLAGRKSILRNLEREAKELAFATSADEVDRVLASQEEEFFFRGPRQERHRGLSII